MTAARPDPPEKPFASDCCDGGCDPCVYDLYAEAMRAYESAMADWRRAQVDAGPVRDATQGVTGNTGRQD